MSRKLRQGLCGRRGQIDESSEPTFERCDPIADSTALCNDAGVHNFRSGKHGSFERGKVPTENIKLLVHYDRAGRDALSERVKPVCKSLGILFDLYPSVVNFTRAPQRPNFLIELDDRLSQITFRPLEPRNLDTENLPGWLMSSAGEIYNRPRGDVERTCYLINQCLFAI